MKAAHRVKPISTNRPQKASKQPGVIESPIRAEQHKLQVVMGRVRNAIKEIVLKVTRPITLNERKQIEFLESIQEKIFTNLIQLNPGLLAQIMAMNNPPLPLECAMNALTTLFIVGNMSKVPQSENDWSSIQQLIKNNESEFLAEIEQYQDLTINHAFERQNIITAKNYILTYIVEEQLSSSRSRGFLDEITYSSLSVAIKLIIYLAEYIIGFVEVYDSLIKSLGLKESQPQKVENIIPLPCIDESQNEQSKLDEHRLETKEDIVLSTAKKAPQVSTPVQAQRGTPIHAQRKIQTPLQKPFQSPTSESSKLHASTQLTKKKRVISATFHPPNKGQQSAKLSDKSLQLKKSISSEKHEADEQFQAKPESDNQSRGSIMKVPVPSPSKNQPQSPTLSQDEVTRLINAKYPEQIVHDEDTNIKLLKELIEKNKSNIRQLMSEQMTLKFKIEKETQDLQKNMDELVEKDVVATHHPDTIAFEQPTHKVVKGVSKTEKPSRLPARKQKPMRQTVQPKTQQQVPQENKNAPSTQSLENLTKLVSQNEHDRVELEGELNRLLKIIDEKSRTITEKRQLDSPKQQRVK